MTELEKLRKLVALYEEALMFYADRDNWDKDPFNPTIWNDGNIDFGGTAEEALEKGKELNLEKV